MRLSGVLPEDDDGSTDLATLEKRLADRAGSQRPSTEAATPRASISDDRRASTVQALQHKDGTPVQPGLPSPRSGTASPEPPQQGEAKEEDTLAEMMCSLVTNNYGETRYIGECRAAAPAVICACYADWLAQDRLPASPSSPPRAFSGSTTRPEMFRSKT